MKVIITKVQPIKAKKTGDEYVVIHYIDPVTGECEKTLVTAAFYDEQSFDESDVATVDQLQKCFSELNTIDIAFNNRGRVSTITS